MAFVFGAAALVVLAARTGAAAVGVAVGAGLGDANEVVAAFDGCATLAL